MDTPFELQCRDQSSPVIGTKGRLFGRVRGTGHLSLTNARPLPVRLAAAALSLSLGTIAPDSAWRLDALAGLPTTTGNQSPPAVARSALLQTGAVAMECTAMTDTPKPCSHPGCGNVGLMALPTGEVLCQQHFNWMVNGNRTNLDADAEARES